MNIRNKTINSSFVLDSLRFRSRIGFLQMGRLVSGFYCLASTPCRHGVAVVERNDPKSKASSRQSPIRAAYAKTVLRRYRRAMPAFHIFQGSLWFCYCSGTAVKGGPCFLQRTIFFLTGVDWSTIPPSYKVCIYRQRGYQCLHCRRLFYRFHYRSTRPQL